MLVRMTLLDFCSLTASRYGRAIESFLTWESQMSAVAKCEYRDSLGLPRLLLCDFLSSLPSANKGFQIQRQIQRSFANNQGHTSEAAFLDARSRSFTHARAPHAAMKLATALTLIAALSHGTLAYVIEAYEELDCDGEPKEINVWDNTCRSHDVPKTRSIKFVAEGGWHQRACIYAEPWCAVGWEDMTFWSDGGSVQVGECINFYLFKAKAFGSWFVSG